MECKNCRSLCLDFFNVKISALIVQAIWWYWNGKEEKEKKISVVASFTWVLLTKRQGQCFLSHLITFFHILSSLNIFCGLKKAFYTSVNSLESLSFLKRFPLQCQITCLSNLWLCSMWHTTNIALLWLKMI